MLRRVIHFFSKRRVEQDLDAELQSTIELLAAEHIRAGASPQDALRLARLELGGIEQVKEDARGARGLPALDSFVRDLRHALRDLMRAPGFSISVVATLGLALGANAAVLSLLDKLILRPLPVSEPDRLVTVVAPPLPRPGIIRRRAPGRHSPSPPRRPPGCRPRPAPGVIHF
jgi:hypothetical protein